MMVRWNLQMWETMPALDDQISANWSLMLKSVENHRSSWHQFSTTLARLQTVKGPPIQLLISFRNTLAVRVWLRLVYKRGGSPICKTTFRGFLTSLGIPLKLITWMWKVVSCHWGRTAKSRDVWRTCAKSAKRLDNLLHDKSWSDESWPDQQVSGRNCFQLYEL